LSAAGRERSRLNRNVSGNSNAPQPPAADKAFPKRKIQVQTESGKNLKFRL
jgi:hypothetical protein